MAIVTMANAAYGDSRLLYAEAQAVASYSFYRHPHPDYLSEFGWYSMDQMDVMQKPAVGFDLVQRLSTETGDWGLLAVQGRFAFDNTHNGYIEPQLYNAYLKVKPSFGDLWVGHNKPAFGLSMSLDNHGTLLQPLSMYGYGFDRDWGAGYYRDFESGNLAFSSTLGSGMPIYFERNYLFSGRVSKGDLNQQNYNIGLSASYGKVLETMGYTVTMGGMPVAATMIGADATILRSRWENRMELLWSRKVIWPMTEMSNTFNDYIFFHRLTLNLMQENRLKLELQTIWPLGDHGQGSGDFGATYQLTSDIALRSVIRFPNPTTRITAQLYWYHKI